MGKMDSHAHKRTIAFDYDESIFNDRGGIVSGTDGHQLVFGKMDELDLLDSPLVSSVLSLLLLADL